MIFCKGEGVLELVQFLVRRNPALPTLKTNRDELAMNLMPPTTNPQHVIDAMQRDQLEARLWLLKKYPQAIFDTETDGETPLVRAIVGRCNLFVEHIVEEFPETLTKPTGKLKKLPLHYAMETGNERAVQILYAKYPQAILIKDKAGVTPADNLKFSLHRDILISAMANVLVNIFELDCPDKHMMPQYLNECNRSIWSEPVLVNLVYQYHLKDHPLPEEDDTLLPPPTPKRITHPIMTTASTATQDFRRRDSLKSRKSDTPKFARFSKKGQFEKLRQSFESPSRPPKITSP
jgi:hypothetical protein